jgi:NAD(P)-dependent dehydrogenase (short-subunit alcohol dehydrogenase family)
MRVRGAINTTVSIQVTHPSPSLLDYAPTRAAIVALTRALAWRVSTDGIPSNCGATGVDSSANERWPSRREDSSLGSKTPMKHPGQPLEMSSLYVLLASQESS